MITQVLPIKPKQMPKPPIVPPPPPPAVKPKSDLVVVRWVDSKCPSCIQGDPGAARVEWHGKRKLTFFDNMNAVMVDGKLKRQDELHEYLQCLDVPMTNKTDYDLGCLRGASTRERGRGNARKRVSWSGFHHQSKHDKKP